MIYLSLHGNCCKTTKELIETITKVNWRDLNFSGNYVNWGNDVL
jgi:hypothetical protein